MPAHDAGYKSGYMNKIVIKTSIIHYVDHLLSQVSQCVK